MRRLLLSRRYRGKSYGDVGDICVYDSNLKDYYYVSLEDFDSYHNNFNGHVVGVCVIPTSHDVYGNGSSAIMSLLGMDCTNPKRGSSSYNLMSWGPSSKDISTLYNYTKVVHLGQSSISNNVVGLCNYGVLPSDNFVGSDPNRLDPGTYYNFDSWWLPSPYDSTGGRSKLYYSTSSPSSSNNAFSDFDGEGNTAKIISIRGAKDYSSWKPGSGTYSDYPAASCCDMFKSPEGLLHWYLPSCGEMGYLIVRLRTINATLSYLKSLGYPCCEVVDDYFMWSSTEYNNNNARRLWPSDGTCSGLAKTYKYQVRAFSKIG